MIITDTTNKNNINFIAKHLDKSVLPELKECDSICAFTGNVINAGIPINMLPATFTDHSYIRFDSEFIGPDACFQGYNSGYRA